MCEHCKRDDCPDLGDYWCSAHKPHGKSRAGRSIKVRPTTEDASQTDPEGKRLNDGRVGATRRMLGLKQNPGYEA